MRAEYPGAMLRGTRGGTYSPNPWPKSPDFGLIVSETEPLHTFASEATNNPYGDMQDTLVPTYIGQLQMLTAASFVVPPTRSTDPSAALCAFASSALKTEKVIAQSPLRRRGPQSGRAAAKRGSAREAVGIDPRRSP
jgi:hypothetical protein